MPTGEVHHRVYGSVRVRLWFVGVVAAAMRTAAQRTRPMAPAVATSKRRRRTPIALTATRPARITTAVKDANADVDPVSSTRVGLGTGSRSHHGGTPMVRTRVFQPVVVPTAWRLVVAAWVMRVRLPGWWMA